MYEEIFLERIKGNDAGSTEGLWNIEILKVFPAFGNKKRRNKNNTSISGTITKKK